MNGKAEKGLARILFYLIQFTWALPVNIIGLTAYLILCRKFRHIRFHNAFITFVPGNWGGVSLGLFIFMAEGRNPEWERNTRIHEYGHTIQALLLGVLYWLVIAIPSFIWCNFPPLVKYRKKNNVSYYKLYCEAWANAWGQKWSGEKQNLKD